MSAAQLLLKPRWCVAWNDLKGERQWCATFRGTRPSEEAVHDRTACGATVIFRVGSERRLPTCLECRERVRAAAKK
jgi:hypothetical protein